MKYLIAAILIIGVAMPACQKNEANVKYTLSDEQLSRLMFDLQLSEVAVSEVTGDARDSLSDLLWEKLVGAYQLSRPQLTEEIRKLETDPVKMKVVMDRVQVLADSIR
jgi:hypothetical protein